MQISKQIQDHIDRYVESDRKSSDGSSASPASASGESKSSSSSEEEESGSSSSEPEAHLGAHVKRPVVRKPNPRQLRHTKSMFTQNQTILEEDGDLQQSSPAGNRSGTSGSQTEKQGEKSAPDKLNDQKT